MALKNLTVKNPSGSSQIIRDRGITIPSSGQETYDTLEDIRQLLTSGDLRVLANAGTLVLNDGTSDIPTSLVDTFILAFDTGLPTMDGSGEPVGVLGFYGQLYKDLAGSWWKCTSKPHGTTWVAEQAAAPVLFIITTEGGLVYNTAGAFVVRAED